MATIPGGTFMMGSNDGSSDETPVHSVTLSEFCMDLTEVTVGAYANCVKGGGTGCKALEASAGCNAAGGGKNGHPQNCVDWDDAKGYCEWAGRRR
jgi:formylglycine-generating enzyme required for sulfatase activity